MLRILTFIQIVFSTINANSQPGFLDQIKIYQLNDPVLKEIQFSVFKKDMDKKKPLLLFWADPDWNPRSSITGLISRYIIPAFTGSVNIKTNTILYLSIRPGYHCTIQ